MPDQEMASLYDRLGMITDQEWDGFLDDLQQAFDRFEVPGQEQ